MTWIYKLSILEYLAYPSFIFNFGRLDFVLRRLCKSVRSPIPPSRADGVSSGWLGSKVFQIFNFNAKSWGWGIKSKQIIFSYWNVNFKVWTVNLDLYNYNLKYYQNIFLLKLNIKSQQKNLSQKIWYHK